MVILARIGSVAVKWKFRHGLHCADPVRFDQKKLEALGIGTQGEQYAYWYLRRLGYIFIARNYIPTRSKGEIDLVGYDRGTLAFVEVRTRAKVKGKPALPEFSIRQEKHEVLVRTAHYFLREWHVKDCPVFWPSIAPRERGPLCGCIKMH